MLSREQSGAPRAHESATVEALIPGARRTIAERLLRAIIDEKCMAHSTNEVSASDVEEQGPAQWLLNQAQAGLLDVPHENIERAVQEIEDGIVGLARARAGLAARWGEAEEAAQQPLKSSHHAPGQRLAALTAQLHARTVNLGQHNHLNSALLARFEQLVGEGHPRHPSAKTCLGLGDEWAQVLPEQIESFECRFVALSEDLVESTGQCLHGALSAELPVLWAQLEAECRQLGIALTCESTENSISATEGFRLIPVHPWQLQNVIKDEFAEEIIAGRLRILDTTVTAEPLMSVRTVRIHDGAGTAHLKLAIEAQLTGAIRGISHGALVGPELFALCAEITQLDGSLAPRTVDDAPAFTTCEDLAGVRYLPDSAADSDRPRRSHCLGAVLRRDPVRTLARTQALAAEDIALPVAALQANNPLTGRPILADILEDLIDRTWDKQLSERSRRDHAREITTAWFAQLADILIVPAVRFAARWGIALEPHPQNTVLVLRDGVPHAAIIRDFGGARVFADAPAIQLPVPVAERAAEAMRETAIACETVEKLTDKFVYPMLTNLWMGLEETLSPHSDLAGADVWTHAAEALDRERVRSQFTQSQATEPSRAELADRVFKRVFAPSLPLKRVLAMRLSGAVTEQEYVRIPNPLHERMDTIAQHWQHMYSDELAQAQADVQTRWQTTCQLEGIDPNCLDPAYCPAGNAATCARVRMDRDQAAEALAHARCRVRFRLLHLRRLALLRARSPQAAAALAGGAATGYWDVLRLFPKALRPAITDSLAVEGHTVHPLAKLRRGFSSTESAAFGPENGLALEMRLVAVDSELLETSAAGALEREMQRNYPHHMRVARAELRQRGIGLGNNGRGNTGLGSSSLGGNNPLRNGHGNPDFARRAVIIPVHPWQWEHIIATEFAELIEAGKLALITSCSIAAYPTISVRTVLPVAPSAVGQRPFIKAAMDVVLTSTRRSMSQDSALGTPDVARLVENLVLRLDRESALEQRVRVVGETAGVAYRGEERVARARGLSTLWREDVGQCIPADEVALSACTLRGQPPGEVAPLAALIAGHATLKGGTGAVGFIRDYARDLLSVTLPLMWTHGVALESHLQNTMVRVAFTGDSGAAGSDAEHGGTGAPVEYRGLVLRDFSGLRMYRERLEAAGLQIPARPGAVTVTSDMREFLDKGYYANVFANLSGMIDAVVDADPMVSRAELWKAVRRVVEEVIAEFGRARVPDEDLEHLLAPALHQKAFASMALDPKGGDRYVDVANPLVS